MSRRPKDTIGAVALYVLICVLVVVTCGALAIVDAQAAIDQSRAQQEALACFKAPQMCVGVQRAAK